MAKREEIIKNPLTDQDREEILADMEVGFYISEEDLRSIGFLPVMIPGEYCDTYGPILTFGRVGIRQTEGYFHVYIDGKEADKNHFPDFDFHYLDGDDISERLIQLYKMTGLI